MARAALAVLSIGSSALITSDGNGTPRALARDARRAARTVATLVREGYRVVVLHGLRPELDRELWRGEEASTKLPPRSLDAAVAATQGALAALLAVELTNALRRSGAAWPVAAITTQVLVGLDDAAFEAPATPVGPLLSAWRAKQLGRTNPEMRLVEEAGRGWRRVAASPRPLEVVQLDAVEALLEAGHIVMAGGGGVPVVVDAKGQLVSVEAVIDPDRTAGLMADHLGAELLVLLTGADSAYTRFGRSDQRSLERIAAAELRLLLQQGNFPPESMGPKVEAALEFVEDGGATAIITSPDRFSAALADRAGTRVSRLVTEGPMRRQIPLFPNAEDDDETRDEDVLL